MDRWRPPAAGLVGYLPDDRKHAFPFPSNLPELLKARESLLKQNAAASPMAKHFDIGLRNIKLSIYHNAQVT
jgi:hypothetical protein